MELVLFVLITAISFGCAIMAVKDRIIGVAGILLMFVTLAVAGNDGTLTINSAWSEALAGWQTRTVNVYPEIIILGFVILIVETTILYTLNDMYKTSY